MSSSTSTTSLKLPPYGKYFLFIQSDGKSDHVARCLKSRALTYVIDLVRGIESFEHQWVILNGLLQSDRQKIYGYY